MKKQALNKTVNNEFNNLVVNAIDFLRISLDEIDSNPKRTIIDFYTALELFIKARLMKEHWSLIITKPELADSADFLKGDFQSVSLKDARQRLKNIVGDDIGEDTFNSFKEIGNYRNRLVHFHNETANLREIVAKDVLKGLYFLNNLLLNKWRQHFQSYEQDLSNIFQQAHKLRDFLKVKFDLIRDEIDVEKLKGFIYNKCLSCKYDSSRKYNIHERIYSSTCMVCNLEEDCVVVNCQKCSNQVFVSDGFRKCDFCGHFIEINEILTHFEPEKPYNKESLTKYEAELRLRVNCDECDFIGGTVVPLTSDLKKWFCISCNKHIDSIDIDECARCSESFVSNQEGLLCSSCDGFWLDE